MHPEVQNLQPFEEGESEEMWFTTVLWFVWMGQWVIADWMLIRFTECSVGCFCLFLESSPGKRNGCLPPLGSQGRSEHTGSRFRSSVRCGAVHCHLPSETGTGCGERFFHSTCICCQRGYFSALEELSNVREAHLAQLCLNKEVITASHLYYILPVESFLI